MTAHPRHSNQSAERMGANAPGPIRRVMSITRALEWAFRVEQARVEFDDLGDAAGSIRQGIDGIWLMMQRGVLGCKIDGGGHSEPAWDAQVIASAVASLPEGFDGRSMAATVDRRHAQTEAARDEARRMDLARNQFLGERNMLAEALRDIQRGDMTNMMELTEAEAARARATWALRKIGEPVGDFRTEQKGDA